MYQQMFGRAFREVRPMKKAGGPENQRTCIARVLVFYCVTLHEETSGQILNSEFSEKKYLARFLSEACIFATKSCRSCQVKQIQQES